MMTRFLFMAALLLPMFASAADLPETKVDIKAFAFGPMNVKVPAGTRVTWSNKDQEPHTVVSTEQAFQSDALDTGDSFSFTFTKPGVYPYFCSMHPHMTGIVEVTGK